MREPRLNGGLFHGTKWRDQAEVANVEFGTVKFTARVESRRKFRVDKSREEVLAMWGKFAVGQYAPLMVAAERLGNAYLDEVRMALRANDKSHITVVFVHAEFMPP
jgi:hypothetical protein